LDVKEKNDYEIFIKQERIRESEIITAYTDGELKAKQLYQEQLDMALAEKEKERSEKELALQKEAEALAKAENAKAEKEKEKAEKEKEKAEKEKTISKLHTAVKRFYEMKLSIEEISETVDISIEEVKDILGI
jgi:peptidoglycan hydrolase CwlO-like protein